MADEKVVLVRLPSLTPIRWSPGAYECGKVVPARVVAEKTGAGVPVARLKNAGGL